MEADDLLDEVGQVIDAELEEEIARQCLDHVSDRPTRVVRDRAGRSTHDLVGAGSDDGDGERAVAVCGAAEQPHESDLVVGPVRPNCNRRHSGRAVDVGHRIGPPDRVPGITGERRRIDAVGIQPTRPVLAEQAVGVDDESGRRTPVRDRAEEHEVLVRQPHQQWVVAGDRAQTRLHRSEVSDRSLHILDGVADLSFEPRAEFLIAPIDLDQRPGLDRTVGGRNVGDHPTVVTTNVQHRVDEQVDAQLVPIENHPNGIDEERSVIGDEHEHRALRLPAVAFQVGREHLDERFAPLAHPTQVEVGHGCGIRELEPTAPCIVVRDLAEVFADERGEECIVRSTLGGHRLQSLDDVGHVVVSTHGGSRLESESPSGFQRSPAHVDM